MNDAELFIETQDRSRSDVRNPVIVILENLRSAYNVGNIFRLAEVCRIEKLVTCGYTATPPHPRLRKTARGCDRLVPSEHYDRGPDALLSLRQLGYWIIGIETVKDAPDIWTAKLSFPLAFVFGNEALGISKDTLTLCDGFARLPVFGYKNSLNVSNCAAVVLYHAVREWIVSLT